MRLLLLLEDEVEEENVVQLLLQLINFELHEWLHWDKHWTYNAMRKKTGSPIEK